MTSIRNAILAGACSLAIAVGAMPAEAASGQAQAASGQTQASGQNTIAGIRMDQIQKVDRRGGWRGGGFGGGNRGWGGGRRFGGGGWGGGRRYYGGGGWGGGRYYGGGRRYYGGWGGGRRYYGYRRDRGYYGGYAAAGVLGLATGAIIANNSYGYNDRPYYRSRYYDDGYYGRSYGGAECQVITKRRGYDGRLYRVTRYRPC